jgi:hypothetical protein
MCAVNLLPLEQLNSKVREVPTRLRENNKKLDTEKRKYEKLLELKPAYESVITCKSTEIPNLRYVHIITTLAVYYHQNQDVT